MQASGHINVIYRRKDGNVGLIEPAAVEDDRWPHIKDLLQGDLIIDGHQGHRQGGVIREFALMLSRAGRVRDADELARVLLEREALGSTGIGDGVAIPHGKLQRYGRCDRRVRTVAPGC